MIFLPSSTTRTPSARELFPSSLSLNHSSLYKMGRSAKLMKRPVGHRSSLPYQGLLLIHPPPSAPRRKPRKSRVRSTLPLPLDVSNDPSPPTTTINLVLPSLYSTLQYQVDQVHLHSNEQVA